MRLLIGAVRYLNFRKSINFFIDKESFLLMSSNIIYNQQDPRELVIISLKKIYWEKSVHNFTLFRYTAL